MILQRRSILQPQVRNSGARTSRGDIVVTGLVSAVVEHIGAALKPFAFETIYGHYFDRVIAKDAKAVLESSVTRYVAAVEGKRGYE